MSMASGSSAYPDGSAGAPPGTPQLAGELAGYPARPPWEVAGINYAVGPHFAPTKDPAKITLPGVLVNNTSHVVTIAGNNVTIDGYDFSLHGGYTVRVQGNNDTISNSKFAIPTISAVYLVSGPGSNLTLEYDSLDGTTNNSAESSLIGFSGSNITLKYNYFKNFAQHVLEMVQSPGQTSDLVYEYNLIQNGAKIPGSHLNYLQFASGTIINPVVEFNTSIQTPQVSSGEGYQFYLNNGGTISNATFAYNTMIATGAPGQISMSALMHPLGGMQYGNTSTGVAYDNYMDISNAYLAFYPVTSSVPWNFSSNYNLKTGSLLTINGDTEAHSPASPVIQSASGTGTTAVLTGTAEANSRVNAFDAAYLLVGTATVSATGRWSLTTSPLAGGVHHFTAIATDATGASVPSGAATANISGGSAPTAFPDRATTAENKAIAINVLANDSDPVGTINPRSVKVSTAAAHGTTSVNATTGAVTYTPAANFYGTDTFRYTVANTLGQVSAPATVSVTVDPPNPPSSSGYADGASGAPAGTPQLPSILAGYTVRPPWSVAGVDYAVGITSGTTLKDPTLTGALPTGASYNASTHTVTVTANNVTLNGFDFSLHSGIEVDVEAANVTVENSKFVVGSNQGSLGRVLYASRGAGNISILDNEFDGANVPVTVGSGQTIFLLNTGNVTFKYNYIHNTGGDAIDFGYGPQTDTIEYNMFANIGVNTGHADTLQWYDSQITSGTVGFNTVYQNVPQPGAGNGALTLVSEGPLASMNNMMVNNDTIIQTASGTSNFTTGFYADMGGTGKNVTIHDLYIDPTGAVSYTGMWLFPTGYYGNAFAQPTAISNVTNMTSGITYTTFPKAQHYFVVPDVNGYTPSLSDIYSVRASQTSGTLNPGNTLTITLNMDEPYTVVGSPSLALNSGGAATYVSGSGTNALVFRYTVGNSDATVATLAVTHINLPAGSSVKDAVGNSANLSGALRSFGGLGVDPPAMRGGDAVAATAPVTMAMLEDGSAASGGLALLARSDITAAPAGKGNWFADHATVNLPALVQNETGPTWSLHDPLQLSSSSGPLAIPDSCWLPMSEHAAVGGIGQ
jgi:hypothetical protein